VSLEVDILRELVAIPSVSSLSNVPVVNCAVKYLEGWRFERYPYTDSAGTAKVNLVAIAGPAGRPRTAELAFLCHTDTVPFEPDWADAVQPRLAGGRLYGRGACDVKGFLACVLGAVSQTDIAALKKPLAIVLTADEEIGCVGAKFLARKKALRAAKTIVGEPTGLQPVRAGKGYALGEIVVRGKEAHSAFPAAGRSAILDGARVVLALERVAKKLASRKNRDFDPPFTTLNVGVIHGGSAKNIIPGECRMTVEWRPVPGHPADWAAELIREELAALAKRDPGFHAEFEVKRLDPPFAPSKGRELAILLESLSKRPSTTVSFGTEAAHLPGEETIVFGPGHMSVAHQSGEYVAVADLRKCVAYFRSVIGRLCT
jgi:acetylornithine deacetylase